MIDQRFVGYVRSVSFIRLMNEMLDTKQIIRLNASRTVQRDSKSLRFPEKPRTPFVFKDSTCTDSYIVEWGTENGGHFPAMKVETLIELEKLGDFGIQTLEYCFQSADVVDTLNAEIKLRSKKTPVLLKPDTKLFAIFANNWSPEIPKIDIVVKLNKKEVGELGFRYSVLDLVALKTERSVNYGETENINVNSCPILVKAILKAIMKDTRWSYTDGDMPRKAKPCAVRVYNLKGDKEWQLQGDEEIA